jgi:NADH-quinone oxidoreductase subunit G
MRFLAEIADDPLPGGPLFTKPFDSHWSGNTADLCPVGALTPGDFYPGVRLWELAHHASVCNHCPVGCNITLQTRVEDSPVLGSGYSATARIKRVQPRQNELVNSEWICDKGRYGYHHSRAADRLTVPLVRAAGGLEPASWDDALDLIVRRIARVLPHQVAGVAGDRLSNEDLFLFQALMRDVIGAPQVNAYPDVYGAGLVARYGLGAGSDWRQLGPGSVILVVAGDVAEQAPVWFLWLKAAAQRGAELLVVNGRPTKLDRYATRRMRARYGSAPHLVLGLTKLLLDNDKHADPPLPVKGLKKLQADLADFGPDTVERLTGVTGDDLQAAAEVFERAEDVIIVFGREGLNNYGALALVQAAANLLLATGHVGRANNGLLPLWPHNNTQGAADMGVCHNAGPGYREIIEHGWNFDSMLSAMSNKSIKLLWMAGASLDAEQALDALDFLIVQDMFLSDTAHRADVVLPTLSFAERDGTYTSGDRRVQRFEQALPPLGQGRADWAILTDVAARLGANWEFASSADVLAAINARVPQYASFTLETLHSAAASPRWRTAAEHQEAELAFEWVELPTLQDADLVAVPVRWLYRRGTLIDHSPPLKDRLRGAVAEFNPRDAKRLDLRQGATVIATLGWRPIELTVYINQRVPQGVVLVPVGLSAGILTVSLWPVSER